MKRILVAIITAMLVLAVVGGVAMAAGGLTSSPKFVFFGQETNFQIANPFAVSWGAAELIVSGTNLVVWPGMKLASVPVTIENISPHRYSANFFVSPIQGLAQGDYPGFDVRVIVPRVQTYGTSVNIEAGQTVTANIEIYISMGAKPVKFQGLQLEVSPGPPMVGEKG